jgi:4-amino-4-deoxychorismate lyase
MRPQLIETLRVEANGRMPLLPWHLERLSASVSALGYRWSVEVVQRAIAREAADLAEGVIHRMRVLVADDGKIAITHAPLDPLPALPKLALAPTRLLSTEPMLRHKTTHRPWYEEAAAWLAAHPDHFDLLYLNERGEVCEGSRTNVYLLRDGKWLTPPVSSGLLPGAKRAELFDNEEVEEAVLTLADLQGATGLRLSNALRGWFDVVLDPVDA